MTARGLQTLSFTTASLGNPEAKITGVYSCDLLSIVMGNAPQGSAWVTIMGNINAIAVASLAEVSAIVLAGGVKADAAVLQKAEENGINLFYSDAPIFETALEIHNHLAR